MRVAWEILAWDEWDNPDRLVYQVQPAWDLRGELPAELSEQTRAVLFRLDRNWQIVPHPDERLPSGGCWRDTWDWDPEDLEERQREEWETWALLPLHETFLALGEERLLNYGPVLVRVGGEAIEASSPRVSHPFVPERFGLHSIQATPPPPGLLRNWSWGWRKTCGPVTLTVRVPRDLEQMKGWLESLDLVGYDCTATEVLMAGKVRGRLAELYQPQEKDGCYRLPDCTRSDGFLDLFAGGFRVWSNFGRLSDPQASADYSLLQSVLRGELGDDVQWEVFDGDYYSMHAQGPSLASLASYLDPNVPEEVERERWNIGVLELNCQQQSDWDGVWRVVSGHFGVEPEGLEAYFAGLRAGEYPRTIRIVHGPLSGSLVLPATRGIVWQFQQPAPAGTQAPSLTRSYNT